MAALALSRKNGNRTENMKRRIAELRTVMLRAGAEPQWFRDEHETWQILRRKPGYVTHHLYQDKQQPQHRLVYSEWESKKTLEGARQFLGGTALGRRLRATLSGAPERLVVELVGPITSTKGLDLPENAIAATAVTRLPSSGSGTSDPHTTLGNHLAAKVGHITHLLFRGFEDPEVVGLISYWQDAAVFDAAIASVTESAIAGAQAALAYVRYEPLRN